MSARLRTVASVVALLATASPGELRAQSAPCSDGALPLPANLPDTVTTPFYSGRIEVGDAPLGVGHLRASGDDYIWDWQIQARIPLFSEPGGSLGRWIADGWVVPQTGLAEPLGTSGMIETGYEIVSFIVLERRDDGWLRLRYAPEESGPSTGWTHECALTLGSVKLEYESWGDRFLSPDISPLYAISQVSHVLRSGPMATAEAVFSTPAESRLYEIHPLEVVGDWMRVRISLPPTYCEFDAPPPAEHEGWMRWRSEVSGPLLWYYTRGC